MSKKTIIGAVVVVILTGWYFIKSSPKTVTPSTPTEITSTPAPSESPASAVTITPSGFSPKSITILVGETVSWTNSDTQSHTVDSGPHPVHTAYPALNLGTIKPGEKKSLSFPKDGTYKYHDHLNSSLTGSITVQ